MIAGEHSFWFEFVLCSFCTTLHTKEKAGDCRSAPSERFEGPAIACIDLEKKKSGLWTEQMLFYWRSLLIVWAAFCWAFATAVTRKLYEWDPEAKNIIEFKGLTSGQVFENTGVIRVLELYNPYCVRVRCLCAFRNAASVGTHLFCSLTQTNRATALSSNPATLKLPTKFERITQKLNFTPFRVFIMMTFAGNDFTFRVSPHSF